MGQPVPTKAFLQLAKAAVMYTAPLKKWIVPTDYMRPKSDAACVSPSDHSLTVDSVLEVMGKVQEWELLGIELEVPLSKRQEIEEVSSTEEEKSHQVGRYWVNTHPDPSWEELGRVLYERGEETAAMMVKQYLPPQGM